MRSKKFRLRVFIKKIKSSEELLLRCHAMLHELNFHFWVHTSEWGELSLMRKDDIWVVLQITWSHYRNLWQKLWWQTYKVCTNVCQHWDKMIN